MGAKTGFPDQRYLEDTKNAKLLELVNRIKSKEIKLHNTKTTKAGNDAKN